MTSHSRTTGNSRTNNPQNHWHTAIREKRPRHAGLLVQGDATAGSASEATNLDRPHLHDTRPPLAGSHSQQTQLPISRPPDTQRARSQAPNTNRSPDRRPSYSDTSYSDSSDSEFDSDSSYSDSSYSDSPHPNPSRPQPLPLASLSILLASLMALQYARNNRSARSRSS